MKEKNKQISGEEVRPRDKSFELGKKERGRKEHKSFALTWLGKSQK